MKISVIIPVLNEEKRIGQVIKGVRERSSGHLGEVIVVDGGSKDQTATIARSVGAMVIQSEKGRGRQMNRGAEIAQHEILYFLHADTLPPAGFDRIIIGRVTEGSQAGCFRLRFDWNHPILNLYAFFTRLKTTLVRFGDQSLFVEKSLFKKVDGFRENLIVMEDQKIVRDLKKNGRFVLCKDEVVTSARKYREVGVVKLQFVFILIWMGYYFGVDQDVLTDLYRKFILPD
jgi:rSAM/selenodomain-associated transferase 2